MVDYVDKFWVGVTETLSTMLTGVSICGIMSHQSTQYMVLDKAVFISYIVVSRQLTVEDSS